MLNIYYGSEMLDKEKFIFDHIDPDRKTIILVPDQYSLQMERNALEYFRPKALFNLMITDFSALGHKAVKEAGGKKPELIDKYGRHMLLSVIIDRMSDELRMYGKLKGHGSFTAMTNELISEMKRYGVGPEVLADAVASKGIGKETFLSCKLKEIGKIYAAYEEAVRGKYLDTEDYMKFYGNLLADSSLTRGADIWVYGFDTFTPLNINIMQRLLAASAEMNVVMTYDEAPAAAGENGLHSFDARSLTIGGGENLFALTGLVMDELKRMAAELTGSADSCRAEEIPRLYSKPKQKFAEDMSFVLAETSNTYAEAERAAAYIMEMIREKGYRFGDFTVICNDSQVAGRVIRRTFDRWGIPAFGDYKRSILHQPSIGFLISFMEIIGKGYEPEPVLGIIKSGLLGWDTEDEETLENYINEYRIRGTGWKKEFTRGMENYADDLSRLNEMRKFIVDIIERARDDIGRRNTAGEKIRGLYGFLERDFGMRNRISELVKRQRELGMEESAAETAQSWNIICGLFEQIDRIIGEERISNGVLKDLISTGLGEVEIGLAPIASDAVTVGTMQRTRVSRTKVLLVVGANEGVLPMEQSASGLLTDKELETLEKLKFNLTKKEEVKRREEQLAVYRMFALPQDRLYVSRTLADEKGELTPPSGIFVQLLKMKKAMAGESDRTVVLGDLTCSNPSEAVSTRKGTLPYMAEAIREYANTGRIDDEWLRAMSWYERNDKESLNRIYQGLIFDNRMESLGQVLANELYTGDRESIGVSASRLEKYSSCPFAHFISYGLGAEDKRVFEVDAREIGTIYHDCLMEFSRTMEDTKSWDGISDEQCEILVRKVLRELAEETGEKVFHSSAEAEFRLERIADICSGVARALVQQVRKGNIIRMRFEEPFGYPGGILPPVEIPLENGKKVYLKGIIDRIDVLDVGGDEAVRIVDYKTGKSSNIDIEYFRSGYKLQLMVYMNAVNARPAGVFHFRIRDLEHNADTTNTPDSYKLEGIIVDDIEIIEAMDEDLSEGSSQVLPIKFVKSADAFNVSGKNSHLISQEDFEALCEETKKQVERICSEIFEGKIDISPKRERETDINGVHHNSCKYCKYGSICMFDTAFDSCRYTMV